MATTPQNRDRTSSSDPSQLKQENRVARLKVAELGDDKLALTRFDVLEGMSELFEVRVEALSDEADIDFDAALGKGGCVTYHTHQEGVRYFNGILVDAQWVGAREGFHTYRLLFRPWLWLLGRQADCRIYKNKTVKEIITDVFNRRGYGTNDYKFDVTRDSAKLEYCVQYRETDLAFVSRLMEEYGFYTYFRHEKTSHKLHIADSIGGHEPVKVKVPPASDRSRTSGTQRSSRSQAVEGQIVPYVPLTTTNRREYENLAHWMPERRFRTGKFELREYDYRKATSRPLVAEKLGTESYEKAKSFENYDYPGRWTDQGEGDHLTKVRLEAEQAVDHRMHASGDSASLYPGALFKLEGHATDDGEYLVVRASHSFGVQNYRSIGSGAEPEVYQGHYEVQAKSHPFRAPQVTPKPRIYGPQTALVVTQEGVAQTEEIDVDDQGRIFVNFHWNREDKHKQCSRAVRVAQMWAGKGWGWQFIPRVGMEVVVEFLEGDPDQPLVTGCVYNSDFPYPYTMPEKKTQSGVKTDSTIDKGNNKFNELRFEDKVGQEEVFFRAEKDHTELIQNIESREILNKQIVVIGEKFDGKDGGMHDGQSRSVYIENGTDALLIENGHHLTQLTKGNYDIALNDGGMATSLDKGNWDTTLKNGNWQTDVTGNIVFRATSKIRFEIKGAGCFIELTPTGITLRGPMININ